MLVTKMDWRTSPFALSFTYNQINLSPLLPDWTTCSFSLQLFSYGFVCNEFPMMRQNDIFILYDPKWAVTQARKMGDVGKVQVQLLTEFIFQLSGQ